MLGLSDLDSQIFAAIYTAGQAVPASVTYAVAEPSLYVVLAWFVFALFSALHAGRHVRVRQYVLALAAAVIARFGVTTMLQEWFMRARPFDTFSLPRLFEETSYSLPSGHATFLFALAAGIFAFDRRAGSILFLVASVVSVSRIMAGVHYPGDIMAGALVGIVVTSACVALARKTEIIPRVASLKS